MQGRSILAEISLRTLVLRSVVVFLLLLPIGVMSSNDPGVRALMPELSLSGLLGSIPQTSEQSKTTQQPVRQEVLDDRDYSRVLEWQRFHEANMRKYWRHIEHAAYLNALEADLVRAVIVVESAADPNAKSHKGALGLMQLMPRTARELKVTDPLDPKQNIHGGTSYLKKMVDRYDGRLDLGLAAYNAGPGRVTKRDGIPNIRETKNYVRSVLTAYAHFKLRKPADVLEKHMPPNEADRLKWSFPG